MLILFISVILVVILPANLKEPAALISSLIMLTKVRKPVNNLWITLLMVFLAVSIFSAPPIRVLFGGSDLGLSWGMRCLAWFVAYYGVFQYVQGLSWTLKWQRRFSKMIAICGIVSALYAIAQAFGMDQWQYVKSSTEILAAEKPHIAATIGNSTYLGVFLAMCLPFVFGVFGVIASVCVSIAIALTGSDTAFICGIICLIPILLAKFKVRIASGLPMLIKRGILVAIFLVALMAFLAPFSGIHIPFNDNGRFLVWKNTINDWKSPAVSVPMAENITPAERAEIEGLNKKTYMLTGRGPGSFEVFYEMKHHVLDAAVFRSAHNEWIEGLYCFGLIGLFLIGMIVFPVIWSAAELSQSGFSLRVFFSLIVAVASSITLPVMHTEPLRMLTVILFSLCFKNILISRR